MDSQFKMDEYFEGLKLPSDLIHVAVAKAGIEMNLIQDEDFLLRTCDRYVSKQSISAAESDLLEVRAVHAVVKSIRLNKARDLAKGISQQLKKLFDIEHKIHLFD